MAARRKLSDSDRLALAISRAIRRVTCTPREVVEALMAVAAGRAVVSNTHVDCVAFEEHAHAAFHGAMDALTVREKGDRLAN